VNLVASALGVACVAAGVGGLVAVCVPPRRRPAAAGIATAAVGAAGLIAGVAALSGTFWSVRIGWLLPLSGVDLSVDPLAGWFMAVTGAVVAITAVYGIGYAGHGHAPTNRLTWTALPVFGWALLLVPVAASVGTFLLCWELMAITSLVLVLTGHAARAAVARAGLWYAAMTQAGFLALLIGLSVYAAAAGGQTFTALRAAHLSPAVRGLVFVLVLVGCGSKSGLVPLHVWLPKAHPEAPSPVSAMLSAGMVNLGVYMVVRVGFDLLHGGARWWWLLTLVLGAVSALYGIIQAAVATDLKVLLAYSTVENMGLIFLGVGAAGVLRTSGADALAGVALAAALLHVANHAGFKTLLFAGAGSVLRATDTSDLDALGGLRSRMPATTALFAIGALGAAALPPGNGFVSEWLLLQALVHAVPSGGIVTAVVMPLAVAVVALTAGLAVATFVKALGVGFFARPRSPGAESARESPPLMLTAMAVAAAGCTALALAPTVLGRALSRIVTTSSGTPAPIDAGVVTLRLDHIGSSLSPLWIAAALTGGLLLTVITVRVVGAGIARRREIALWDCGAGAPSARMQYTATSFAEPVQRVFDDVLAPRTDIAITPRAESRYILERITYQREVPDRIEHHFYQPLIRGYQLLGRLAPKLGNGSVHRYLTYGFTGVTALLIVLAVFR
jgi:formate hydrogenlyase subunit 3/multisubunit Na+/H+ antiporter MnhD subunit